MKRKKVVVKTYQSGIYLRTEENQNKPQVSPPGCDAM
jgi:hypothetical protein